ncbi:hypothetical protein ACRYWZ_17975 (plasmid) [Agrobacterium deltaense]|uniref:hypothetical protein n=1 Tax=Agrobacterium deltaense TaxID=1183412 RepID=UPI003D98F563
MLSSQRTPPRESDSARVKGDPVSPNRNLPSDVLAKVATYVPTQDVVETARDLGNLERTGSAGREAVRRGPVGIYHTRVKRIGTSAKAVFDTIIPGDQLPDWQVNRPSKTARTRAVGPLLKFQSEAGKARFMTNIMNLPQSNQCDAILSVIKHLDDLGEVNKTRLIERSIEILQLDPPLTWNHGQKCPAADVLVQGEKYLNDDQKTRVQHERNHRPELVRLFRRAVADFEIEKDMEAHPRRYQDAREPEVKPIDEVINTVERYSRSVVARGPNDIGLLTAHESFVKNVGDAYTRTRAEFDASSRDRDRSELSR